MTFVVAAVAGVVGNQLTGQTWALVVFVVLLLVGGGVTYWLERGSRPGGGGSGAAVDLRGAQGAQVGSQNWQVNHFGSDQG
ncbi:MAG TPA: hypothetical protein VLJ59_18955 [Mycobacteriales bacterium]|nr:hypothetical protein [Mycobacteriales bacterium]